MDDGGLLVYFSSKSENTHRFVERLGIRAKRIPISADANPLLVDEPFVLMLPTYGGGGVQGAVPKPVIRFLNNYENRRWIRGVIAAGNTNFGDAFCLGGRIVAQKCNVPHLYSFELLGTADDVRRVSLGLRQFWHECKK